MMEICANPTNAGSCHSLLHDVLGSKGEFQSGFLLLTRARAVDLLGASILVHLSLNGIILKDLFVLIFEDPTSIESRVPVW